jgi:hypothetical protein
MPKRPIDDAPELASEDDILETMVRFLESAHVAADRRLLKLLYLTFTSRLLDRPLCVVVKGPSASGKSFAVEAVRRLFPPSAYVWRTSLSPRAIVRTNVSFVHKILVLVEASGLRGEWSDLMLRSLVSEGRVAYEASAVERKRWHTEMLRKKGPTGLIETTTSPRLNPELETRVLSVTPDTSRKHQRHVLESVVLGVRWPNRAVRDWRAVQLWLAESGVSKVDAPFMWDVAHHMAARSTASRLNRDFGQLQQVVKANALLHQVTRPKSDRGIQATAEDYAVAHELTADLFSTQLELEVPRSVRRAVQAVETLRRSRIKRHVTVTAIAEEVGIHKSNASRDLEIAIELGYVVNEAPPGQPFRLRLGEPMPHDSALLPSPKQVRRWITQRD